MTPRSIVGGVCALVAIMILPLSATAQTDTDNQFTKPFDRLNNVRDQIQDHQDQVREQLQDRRDELQQRRDELHAEKEERKEVFEERREEHHARLDALRRDRIDVFADRMLNRFENALDRLSNLRDRIMSRIKKLEDRGLDMDSARAHVEEGDVLLAEAHDLVDDIPSMLDDALDPETPKEAFEDVRALFREAKELIKATHASFVDAITLIRQDITNEIDSDDDTDEDDDDDSDAGDASNDEA